MDSDNLEKSEQECAAGRTAPRVSLADIKAAIAGEFYVTGDRLLPEELPPSDHTITDAIREAAGLLTICLLVLKNGFTIIGKSAPASAANFDAELGMKLAYEDAVRQVWPFMGFALRDRLHRDLVSTEEYMRATGQSSELHAIPEPEEAVDPMVIPDDETLENMPDNALIELSKRYGTDGVTREDDIAKLKAIRDGQTQTDIG